MGKFTKANKQIHENNQLQLENTVKNFMGGDSYVVDPLETLKMISASSIFGEPSYYRGSKLSGRCGTVYKSTMLLDEYVECGIIMEFSNSGETTDTVMEKAIDAALDFDFKGTLEWAVTLRNDYFMRLNPQVILVRAARHPKRIEFTSQNPGLFRELALKCMRRADDALSGMAYYIYDNKGKHDMPSVLKRAYADKLSSLDRYQVAKYANAEIGMINGVRICHANSPVLNELMQNGSVKVTADEMTWENLRSAGKSWEEIFATVKMGHMAMVRNLRGFFSEVDNFEICKEYLEKLKAGVKGGKQFPFRYYSAYKAIDDSNIKHKQMVLDTLEDCIDIAVGNMPRLKGRTVVLSDNSGSAWGGFTSEYGKMVVAEIDNLSAVITAAASDEGVVYKFGDRLKKFEISKRQGLLKQAMEISKNGTNDVGGSTEGGIWEFFRDAIANKEHWDNIFIYSDMQAGTGGLYGTLAHDKEYRKAGYNCLGRHINVFKLILEYRKSVFSKVNVFSVQTAGYDNNVLPQYAYRTNLMYGWTGKENIFASMMIEQWDELDAKKKREKHDQLNQ